MFRFRLFQTGLNSGTPSQTVFLHKQGGKASGISPRYTTVGDRSAPTPCHHALGFLFLHGLIANKTGNE